MWCELNYLVGKVLVVGLLLVAGVYGMGQLGGWCEQFREMRHDAKQNLGEIEPIQLDTPSVEELMREQTEMVDAWQRKQNEKWRDFGNRKPETREAEDRQ